MNVFKRMIKKLQILLENHGKARALARLSELDPRLLQEYGFSIKAMQQGISAWPWREPLKTETPAVSKIDPKTPAVNEVEHKEAA